MHAIPKEIFKAYDIRGIVGSTLSVEIVEKIGQALGSEARARNQTDIVIGRDGRLSGVDLAAARHSKIRHQRDRSRHGHHAHDLLRRLSVR